MRHCGSGSSGKLRTLRGSLGADSCGGVVTSLSAAGARAFVLFDFFLGVVFAVVFFVPPPLLEAVLAFALLAAGLGFVAAALAAAFLAASTGDAANSVNKAEAARKSRRFNRFSKRVYPAAWRARSKDKNDQAVSGDTAWNEGRL